MPPEGQTPGLSTTPTAPAASPASAPQLNPDVFNGKGQKWQDLYNGVLGSTKQLEATHATAAAEAAQQLTLAQDGVTNRDDQIAQLTATSAEKDATVITLSEQAKQLPDLLQRSAYADNLEMLMLFPKLVTAQIEQEIPGEDGAEPTKVMVNPYLQMIKATTLAGDDLRTHLAQLSAASAVPQATTAAPTLPAPAQPNPAAPEGDLAALNEILRKNPGDQAAKAGFYALLTRNVERAQQGE